MADNTRLNAGAGGDLFATDEIAGVKHQRVKIQHGADGSATDVSSTSPLPVSNSSTGAVKTIFSRQADTVGNGTGDFNAIGNYSSGGLGETIFRIAPGAGEVYRITRMLVGVYDSSGMQCQEYGNLGSALTNGVVVRVHNGTSTLIDLTDNLPIKYNGQWGALCYDADVKSWGNGNELLVARWTFERAGQPIRLDGDNNEELQVVLNDNMTGLIEQTFTVQGYIE